VRVSYHPAEHQRLWGAGALGVLAERCRRLAEAGLRVSRVKSEADVGIYMVAHPDNHADATEAHRRDVFFETKEFLGIHDKRLYGSYLYPYSTDLIASGVSPSPLYCECRTTELLIDPMGFVWSCHFHLYSRWKHGGGTAAEYGAIAADGFRWRERMGEAKVAGILGHILDPDFTLAELRRFRACGSYGLCVGCDTKVKNDRFQSLSDRSRPHTSVEIRALSAPQSIRDRMGERCAVSPFAEFEDL
ncbi:MAG TPA: hypothetical protein VK196_04240, partial [Magnetospirillum sp.]|nr:hypothetical protein [Magnetospirillum sp.]